NQMDQGTQQNAAMVEETSAATHRLSAEAGGLVRLIARVKLSDDAPAPAALVRNEPHRPVASPACRAIAKVARAFGG
ncbi:chemotaxis protein, partial [Rhizobium leguminosarum]